MAIAFFDLDKTLLSTNSGVLWIRRDLARGHITRWQALRASAWMARYHLGFASMEDALLQAISMLAGTREADVRERSEAFFHEQVRALYRPGALKALAEHRQAGDRLVLLTSSTSYLSELVSKELGLDDILCNRLEVDAAGLYTGRPIGPICFGKGKLAHAEGLASTANVLLSDCTFYTDSYSDLSVLQAVGHPVAVNPDHRLRREAKARGWPVLDWGEPLKNG